MASTFYLEMVSPQDIFYSGNARQIILPGLDGAYGVLPNHEPMVTAITAGIVRYQDQEGRWHMCVASDGCVEVMPERVIVLAATIERAEDIDRDVYKRQAAMTVPLAPWLGKAPASSSPRMATSSPTNT